MKLAPITIWLAALFFIVYGFAFAIFPAELFLLVTGGELTVSSSLIDVRSTYGGMSIAVGAAILALYRQGAVESSLQLVTGVLLCMAIPRLLGFVLDGAANWVMGLYFALEIGGAALASSALTQHQKEEAVKTVTKKEDLISRFNASEKR